MPGKCHGAVRKAVSCGLPIVRIATALIIIIFHIPAARIGTRLGKLAWPQAASPRGVIPKASGPGFLHFRVRTCDEWAVFSIQLPFQMDATPVDSHLSRKPMEESGA